MFLKESSTKITYQNMKSSVILIMGKKSEIFNIFFPKIQDLFLSKFPLFSLKISSQLKFSPILTSWMAAFWIWAVTSQFPAASDEILEIIHCGCKTGCKQHQCSCVRHGIMCGPGCVNCNDNCENRADSDD